MPNAQLQVARDPALALVVRIFVGAVAQRGGLPEPVQDDLRLAASELFSGAVEAGEGETVSFTVSSGDAEFTLRAEGVEVGPAPAAGDGEPWQDRFGLVRTLFPDAEVGDAVTITLPLGG